MAGISNDLGGISGALAGDVDADVFAGQLDDPGTEGAEAGTATERGELPRLGSDRPAGREEDAVILTLYALLAFIRKEPAIQRKAGVRDSCHRPELARVDILETLGDLLRVAVEEHEARSRLLCPHLPPKIANLQAFAGEADDLPEEAFLYTGTLEDVRARAKEMEK